MSIRRELAAALCKVDESEQTTYADFIKLHIIQTGIFAAALRVVEFYQPVQQASPARHSQIDSQASSSEVVVNSQPSASDPIYKHGLSKSAYEAAANKKLKHGLEPLMSGPLMLLTLPTVSPAHLKAALSILSSSKAFPAPKRRTNPSFHEPAVQSGLQKLLLLGARAEGRIFDLEGAQWIGSIEGGLTGLRAQLVTMLQGFGANLTNTLEAASKSLYFTLESRRDMLEEEGKEDGKDEGKDKKFKEES
jgi:large subunit ribosomal protein L10